HSSLRRSQSRAPPTTSSIPIRSLHRPRAVHRLSAAATIPAPPPRHDIPVLISAAPTSSCAHLPDGTALGLRSRMRWIVFALALVACGEGGGGRVGVDGEPIQEGGVRDRLPDEPPCVLPDATA